MSRVQRAVLEGEVAELAEELSSCYEELALLHGLTDRLRPFTDADRVVRTVLETVVQTLRVRYAFMVLIDNASPAPPSVRVLWVGFTDGVARRLVHGAEPSWPMFDGITREALQTGRPVIVNNVMADVRFRRYPMIPITSMLTVPLKGHDLDGEGKLGALNAANRLDGRGFTSGDLKRVATLAGLASAALENALLVASLRRTNHELQDANRTIVAQQTAMVRTEKLSSLGRMAAGIAHELRNPLAVILGHAQLVRMKMEAGQTLAVDQMQHKVVSIEEQVQRADRIIRSLSTYARGETTEIRSVDLRGVITDVLELVRPQVKMDQVEVSTDLATDLPPIRGNHDQLLQVFINLIVNAAQAMPTGGAVSLVARAVPAGRVTVAVTDTGCGIPPENLQKIFDPFFTTKPAGEGTGLGLSIIHGIVESHGGTITVASEADKGTTFTLQFPAGSSTSS
jgi:signal transduction histidine kinase